SAVTHEIGHCLGLAHSVSATSIMSYRDERTSTLSPDDQYAITLLYPKGSSSYPVGCATIQNNRSRPSSIQKELGDLAYSFLLLMVSWMGCRLQRTRNTVAEIG